jgi:hypothetical protein
MKKVLSNFVLWAALSLSLFVINGCASMNLDTLNKQQAAVEISYQETLRTIVLWAKEGRLTQDEIRGLQTKVKEFEFALDGIAAAKAIGDLKTAKGQLATARGALIFLRNYVDNKEGVQ